MGITTKIIDNTFTGGIADAENLGDQGSTISAGTLDPDWIPASKRGNEEIFYR